MKSNLSHQETEMVPMVTHRSQDVESNQTLLPEAEAEAEAETRKKRGYGSWSRMRGSMSNWRITIALAASSTVIVIAFNLGFLLWAVPRHHVEHNRGVLYEGDCDHVQRTNTGFHLLINILSTALLGASNYGMQFLCAPSRRDVDRVHQRGGWLDIGVPSLRNLLQVSRKRLFLWICLAASSIPLHLFYNSTIFSTTSASLYNVYPHAGPFGTNQSFHDGKGTIGTGEVLSRLYEKQQREDLHRLDPSLCVNAYATTYQTTYGSLFLVADYVKNDTMLPDTMTDFGVYYPSDSVSPYSWMCSGSPHGSPPTSDRFPAYVCAPYLSAIRSQAAIGNWSSVRGLSGHPIKYCLSEKLKQHCRLQYSLPLALVVIVFNFIKAAIMCYIVLSLNVTGSSPLLTSGDAVASFLRTPDRFTQGRCLLSRKLIEEGQSYYGDNSFNTNAERENLASSGTTSSVHKPRYEPLVFDKTRRRWYSAVSGSRWAFCLIFWLIAIIVCFYLLRYGIVNINDSSQTWSTKLGSVNTQTLISGQHWPTSLIPNTIIANIPQLIFSMLYFAFNSVLTTMALAAEWSRYAIKQKGLRVSTRPQKLQQTSYFISLPYKFGMPLITTSAVLHWLISQSIFLVGIETYDQFHERDPHSDITTCGYSPFSILVSSLVGVLMLICLVGLSFRRFASAMPVASSCSLAIAAACHPDHNPNLAVGAEEEEEEEGKEEEEDLEKADGGMELALVKWGVVYSDGIVGHCSFSSEDVDMPEAGKVYR